MKRGRPGDHSRLPFQEGEPILIVDIRGKEHVVRLQAGHQSHHGRAGLVAHDEIIGQAPGLRVSREDSHEFVCVRPTMEEFILKRLRRKTQIIYPKDLGNILIGGNVFPGARVLESGIGSGSATITLLRFLGRKGKLISYEQRPDFIELTRKTIEDFQGLYGKFEATHEIKNRDVYEGIEEEDLDTILLDVPEPERVVDSAAVALRPNGVLLCWLPTALQIHTLVRALKLSKMWAQVETTETIVRPWHVGPKSVRPELQMIAHTGFLTVGRRIVRLDAESG